MFCSSARESFLVLSAAGRPGNTPETRVQLLAPAGVHGPCSRGSKSRNMANNHGEAFRALRATQTHVNPHTRAKKCGRFWHKCRCATCSTSRSGSHMKLCCKTQHHHRLHHQQQEQNATMRRAAPVMPPSAGRVLLLQFF